MRDTKIRQSWWECIFREKDEKGRKRMRDTFFACACATWVFVKSRKEGIFGKKIVKGKEEHRIETARSLLFVGIRLRKLHLLRGGKDQGGNKVAGRSAGRIRGNPCRTKFAIERSSRWRFMSCRDRLLVTPWIVDGYPCGKPHTLATIPEQQWTVEVEIEKLFCVIRESRLCLGFAGSMLRSSLQTNGDSRISQIVWKSKSFKFRSNVRNC